ncbi:sugar ABC transporter ATP-binding protein [Baekduia alba]|uniref:sugar ABC transporter ATP-binding protein n=1 Tax=Baekduia alba TaxID=2997333 RepID=UPI002341A6F4|nr:sugar ABC transporter ATP-binding protein [Baekduia alba]
MSGVRPAGETDPALGPGTERPVALRADNLAKAFGPTKALRACSFELRAGEVHCIVGENGSGKSTLVKILSGIHRPDSGQLDLPGTDATKLTSPAQAARAGIATVFQEVLVVEPRSVLENVWMGVDGVLRTAVALEEKRARAATILERLLGTAPDLDRPVEHLTLSERQACCLARALVREPRVLILDEATSALDIETRNRLFALLRESTAAGTSVIFISHRMDEIADIGDRCTVMRSGDTVATLARHEATAAELVRLMTGADHLAAGAAERAHTAPGDVVLEVEGFTLRAGELVGLAGLEGHGQDAFLRALATSAGARAAYVPRERRAESIFESKSIRENFGIVTLGRDARRGLLSPARTRARLGEYVDRLRIKLGDPEDAITTLSGGNQQKVVMARWLATEPEVLLLNDPTRGVDINAKRDLYALLLDLAADGMAIVMLSTEVDEHVELMDRVVVFREGQVAAELPRDALNRQALVAAFFGEAADA